MEIVVLNTQFEPVCVVDDYISIVWTDRYSEEGEFSLVLSPTAKRYEQLALEYYLEIPLSEHTMIIESVSLTNDRDSGQQMTVTGRSMESILERRLCMSLVDGGSEPELNDSVPILARMYGVVLGAFAGITPNIYSRAEYDKAIATYFADCADIEIPAYLCCDEEPWSMEVPLYSEDREFSTVKTAKVGYTGAGPMWKRETVGTMAVPGSSGGTLGKGSVVYFKGGYHYAASTAMTATGSVRSAGKAKITLVSTGAAHPYHLVGVTGGSNVYGWVDAADISGVSSEIESDDEVGVSMSDRVPLGMCWGFLNETEMSAAAVVKNCYYRRVPNFTVYPIMAYPAWVQVLYNFGVALSEENGETTMSLTAGELVSGFADGVDKSCAEIIKSYCDMSLLGYQITREDRDLQFRVLHFTDKSLGNTDGNDPIVLSAELGNLSSDRYSKTVADDYTIAYCIPTYATNAEVAELLSQDEITDEKASLGMNSLKVYEAPKPQAKGLARIERNTGEGGEDECDFGCFGEQTVKHLTDEDKRSYSTAFDGEMVQGGQYFDDIELGDVVTLMNCFGERFKAAVTEITYSCDVNGVKKTPTFKMLNDDGIALKFVVTDISPTDYGKGWKIGVCGLKDKLYFRQSNTKLGDELKADGSFDLSFGTSEDVLFSTKWSADDPKNKIKDAVTDLKDKVTDSGDDT